MTALKKKINYLRRLIVFYIIWPVCFLLGCLFPIRKNTAVFAYNKNYTELPDNMKPIFDYYKKSGWKCIIYSDSKNALQRLIGDMRFQFIYATSAVIFVTDNFTPLDSHRPRKGTRVVQLWHACGAFKKWGYSTLEHAWGGDKRDWEVFPRHTAYTDVFVSSEEIIPFYAQAFNCSEDIIRPLGAARTDIFFEESFRKSAAEKMREAIPAVGKRKIILYAPTFRGNNPGEAHNDDVLDIDSLYKELSAEYALVIRYHPFTLRSGLYQKEYFEKYPDFVFLCPQEINMEISLCASDILVSDYSSIIFEYSLLDRPMIFFAYDLDEYTELRDYYYDYRSFVPGKIVFNSQELSEELKAGSDTSAVKEFRNRFMSACDGSCTKKICEYTMTPRS